MDQLIQAFGIDARLIVVQIFNFVILMGLLSYLLYKPVLRLLQEREERIALGIKDAEAAAAAKAESETEKQAVLTAAHQEATSITKRAEVFASEQTEAAKEEAAAKAAAMLDEAAKKSEELKVRAKKESEAEVTKLAVLAAEKILREQTS